MRMVVSLHTHGAAPKIQGRVHHNSIDSFVVCSLSWPAGDLALFLDSQAELIALGQRIEAEGRRLEAARLADPTFIPSVEADAMVEVTATEPPF